MMWKKEITKYLVPASIFGFALAMAVQPVQAAEVNMDESYEEMSGVGTIDGVDINDIYDDGYVIGDDSDAVKYSVTGESYEVDSMTGIPYGVDGVDSRNMNPYIKDGCYYDMTLERYVYAVGTNSEAVVANIADGMITSMPVGITVDSAYTYVIYRNGKEVGEEYDISNLQTPGAYVLEVNDGIDTITPIKFRIVGEYTNIDLYEMPQGFMITSVTRDSGEVNTKSSEVSLEEEGSYVIDYRCMRTKQDYRLSVKVDHTAPVLALEALNEKNEAHGPVDISDIEVEEDFGIRILFEGEEEVPYQRVLTNAGSYEITVADAAGNLNTYAFEIRMYLNISSIAFILLLLASIAGIVAYLIISKKKLKVR